MFLITLVLAAAQPNISIEASSIVMDGEVIDTLAQRLPKVCEPGLVDPARPPPCADGERDAPRISVARDVTWERFVAVLGAIAERGYYVVFVNDAGTTVKLGIRTLTKDPSLQSLVLDEQGAIFRMSDETSPVETRIPGARGLDVARLRSVLRANKT